MGPMWDGGGGRSSSEALWWRGGVGARRSTEVLYRCVPLRPANMTLLADAGFPPVTHPAARRRSDSYPALNRRQSMLEHDNQGATSGSVVEWPPQPAGCALIVVAPAAFAPGAGGGRGALHGVPGVPPARSRRGSAGRAAGECRRSLALGSLPVRGCGPAKDKSLRAWRG